MTLPHNCRKLVCSDLSAVFQQFKYIWDPAHRPSPFLGINPQRERLARPRSSSSRRYMVVLPIPSKAAAISLSPLASVIARRTSLRTVVRKGLICARSFRGIGFDFLCLVFVIVPLAVNTQPNRNDHRGDQQQCFCKFHLKPLAKNVI